MANPITNKVKMGKTPVIKKDLEGGVLGEANNDGTIFVDKSVKEGTPMYKEVVGHEMEHMKQMQSGELSYDDNSVTYKGKKFLRKNGRIVDPNTGKGHPEGSMKFAWEKEADKAGKEARKEGNKNNNDDMDYNKNSSMNMNSASPITKKAKDYGSAFPIKKKPNKKGENNQQQDLNTFYSPQDFMPGQGTGLSYNYQSRFPFSRGASYDENNVDAPSSANARKPKVSANTIDDIAMGKGTGLSYDYRAGLPTGMQTSSDASDPDKPTIISKPPTMTSKTFAGFNVPGAKPMIKPIEIFNDNIEIDQGELEETGETFNVSELSPDLPMTGVRKRPKTISASTSTGGTASASKTPGASKTSGTSRAGEYVTTAMEARDKAAASRVKEREGRRNIRQSQRAIDKYRRMPEDRKPIDPRTMKPFATAEDYAKYKVRQADFTNASGQRVPTPRPKDETKDNGKVNNLATESNTATASGTAMANFLSGAGRGLSRSINSNLKPITRIETPAFKLPGYGKKK